MNLHKSLKNRLCLLLLILFSNVALAQSNLTEKEKIWIKANPIVKTAGGPDWVPFDFAVIDKNNKSRHIGISQEILDIISKKTGLTFVIEINPWNINLEKVQSGQLDLLPILHYTDQRAESLIFSDPYLDTVDFFFIRDDVEVNKISDLDGYKVAIPKGYSYELFFQKNYPQIEIITTETLTEAIITVLDGGADILYDSYSSLTYTLKQKGINSIIPFKASIGSSSKQLYMASSKGNSELIGILNKALESITPKEKSEIWDKWSTVNSNVHLQNLFTQQELQWIENNPVVYFGADQQWPPFEFADVNGQLRGMSADYVNKLEEITGLNIQIESGVWIDILDKVKSGELDGFTSIIKNEKRAEYLNFTDPYVNTQIVVAAKNGHGEISNIDQLIGKNIAVINGSFVNQWLIENYPQLDLILTETNEQAIKSVINGNAEIYIGNLASYDYNIKKHFLLQLEVILIQPQVSMSVSFAVTKQKKHLFNIINKAFDYISESEKIKIRDIWYNNYFTSVNLSQEEFDFIVKNNTIKYSSKINWMPFEEFSKNQRYQGINGDYIKLIEDMLDVKFDIQNIYTSEINNSQIDMFSDDADNKYLHHNYEISDPYITDPVVIVMHQENGFVAKLSDLHENIIAIPDSYNYKKEIIAHNEKMRFFTVSDSINGIKALLNQEIDALLLPLAEAKYLLQIYGDNDLSVVGMTQALFEMSFFVKKDKPELLKIINKALNNISAQQKMKVLDNWFEIKFAKQIDYRLLYWYSFIMLVICLLLFLWAKTLLKEIKRRKNIQKALKVEKSNFKTLFERSADGNIILHENRIVNCNQAVLDMLGFESKAQLIRTQLTDILGLKQPDGQSSIALTNKMIVKCKKEGFARFQVAAIKKGQQNFWMDVILMPIEYNKDECVYIIWRDVTQHVALNHQLLSAQKSADEANQAKSEFLANMSHEIRTPMNALLGFTDLLEEQINDSKHQSFIRTIKVASKNLLSLINDVLDLSKIEAGKLKSQKVVTNPFDLLNEICQVFSLGMQKKGLGFQVEIDSNLPKSILIDAIHLRQILFNLLGNALKFTDHGYITFKAYVNSIDHQLCKFNILFEVKDTGIGIASEQLQNIFNVFEQQKGQDKNKYRGTGLGLSISKKLVENMGGQINVNSQLGTGSCFTVQFDNVDMASLEINEQENELLSYAQHLIFKSAHIVVADDIKYNRDLLVEIFHDTEITVHEADNGKQAYELVKNGEIDLVIMDIRMPVMNGYEATEKIKSEFPNLPIIALTASVLESEHHFNCDLFSAYIRKPVNKKDLFDEIARFLDYRVNNTQLDKEFANNQTHSLDDRKNIEKLLKSLNAEPTQLYKVANQTNNVSDIESFLQSLLVLDCGQIPSFDEYVEQLQQDLEIFDITGLQNTLLCFSQLKVALRQSINA